MGARLARSTRNESYAAWAEKSWDWLAGVNYIDGEYNAEHAGCRGVGRAASDALAGGTSKGDPGAGNHVLALGELTPVTKGDRAGAAILTAFLVVSMLAGMWWLMRDETMPWQRPR
jgi:hypothetical protein